MQNTKSNEDESALMTSNDEIIKRYSLEDFLKRNPFKAKTLSVSDLEIGCSMFETKEPRDSMYRVPMRHHIETEGFGKMAEYQWKVGDQWCRLSAQTVDPPKHPQEGSLEQFITEHYWGYSTQRGGGCLEYYVSHAPWQVWATSTAGFEGEASALYGCELGAVLQRRPDCAFVADGSPVIVFKGDRI